MNRFSAWLPSRRQLQQHLSRLLGSLEDLLDHLRERIARTVGDVVASTVRELIALLTGSPRSSPSVARWKEREPALYDEWNDPDYGDDDRPDDEPDARSQERPSAASRWRRAIAVGCQLTAFWLRRQVGLYPVLVSTGLGLSAALISYSAGPDVGVGLARVLGTLLHLVGLSESVQAGAGPFNR